MAKAYDMHNKVKMKRQALPIDVTDIHLKVIMHPFKSFPYFFRNKCPIPIHDTLKKIHKERVYAF